jgi:hypothetical protein
MYSNKNIQANKFKDDLTFGLTQEDVLLDVIQKKFDIDLAKTKRNCTFDYESKKVLVELKTRRVKKDQYPDSMIGLNKIELASTSDREVYFVFQFTDGLYYWKYNKEDKLEYRGGGRCDRGKNEFKDYCYIPTALFSPF